MITFKAIVIPGNRRKDGTYPVNIRVTFRGKSRRLPTTLVCTQADLTRTLRIKSATILNRSDELITRMRTAVSDLSPFDLMTQDVDWVVRHIRDRLKKESFRLDFFEWAYDFIMCKTEVNRKGYVTSLKAFERFLGRRSIDINDITRPMLLDFVDMVESENKMHYNFKTGEMSESGVGKIQGRSSSRHIVFLEHMFNAAKERFNDEDSGRILIPRSPFSRIARSYPMSHGQVNLGRDLMQRIISSEASGSIRTALDVFVVSFAMMGANMADLYAARPVHGDTWVYHRQKTTSRRADKAEMRVTVPDQVQPYLERLMGTGEWWLNTLHTYAKDKDAVTCKVNSCLKAWCVDNGVQPFTFYAARHTWASLARKEGIDKSTIDDCLGHKGSFQVADIYAERAWNVMQEANRRVLDLFTWPPTS